MEKNTESSTGLMEKMALIADALQNTYPNGKSVVVFALNKNDFIESKKSLLVPDQENKQFKIDISGTEFIFLPDELLNDETDNS
jgi:hypothetical protein